MIQIRILLLILFLTSFLSLPGLAGPGDVFYFEDFSQTEAGYLPSGWVGGKNLMVKEDRGRKMLVLFQGREDGIIIPNLRFPKNWQLDIVLRFGGRESNFGVAVGSKGVAKALVQIESTWGKVWLNDSGGQYGELEDQATLVTLRQEGSICKLLINGGEVLTSRLVSKEVAAVRGLTGTFAMLHLDQGRGSSSMVIYSVKGTEL